MAGIDYELISYPAIPHNSCYCHLKVLRKVPFNFNSDQLSLTRLVKTMDSLVSGHLQKQNERITPRN